MTAINVTSAMVVLSSGADRVFLKTDMQEATFPFTGNLTMTCTVAHGHGAKWVRDNLNIEPRIVPSTDLIPS